MTSYWPAIVISFISHGLLLLFISWGWDNVPLKEPVEPPKYIKASIVDLKPKANQGAPKVEPKPKKIDLQKKRQEQERLKQKKLAEEKARKAKVAKEKAAKAKKLAEQKQREQEALKRQAEHERQRLEKEIFEENLAKERERLEAEQRAETLAQQAEEDELLAQSFSQLIQQRIQQNWSRPPSARNDMEALLTIQLIPTGEVIDVAITRGSGNAAYDRSAIQAVKKVRQFPEIREMPSRLFEKEFRQFQLIFKPQDLRQ